MAAPLMRNGSYMVFRRLEQKVPEFRRFVREQAGRLGMDSELLAARMVGRWKSGAPMELAPRLDDPRLGRIVITTSTTATTPSNANVLTLRIFARCTRATMRRAERRRRSGIASFAPASRSVPK